MKQPLALMPLKCSRPDKVPYSYCAAQSSVNPAQRELRGWVKGMRAWDRGLSWVEGKMILAVGVLIFALMILVSLDALSRYAFNRPFTFTVDVSILYLLPGVLFLALSHTLRGNGHICVDLFASMLPPRLHQVIIGLALLLAAVMIAMMAWKITTIAHESWVLSLFASGPYAWPIWVSEAGVAFSVVVLTLRLLQMSVCNLLAGLTGEQAVALSLIDGHEQAQEENA
ncbi:MULTISPECIES: TRAP transporter small permease subunit [Pseudomonas]|uniref:TRAP transporter small permease subunit n=1 Tax=Pseudomonas TaxID=286 RepID=UPI0038052EF9